MGLLERNLKQAKTDEEKVYTLYSMAFSYNAIFQGGQDSLDNLSQKKHISRKERLAIKAHGGKMKVDTSRRRICNVYR